MSTSPSTGPGAPASIGPRDAAGLLGLLAAFGVSVTVWATLIAVVVLLLT